MKISNCPFSSEQQHSYSTPHKHPPSQQITMSDPEEAAARSGKRAKIDPEILRLLQENKAEAIAEAKAVAAEARAETKAEIAALKADASRKGVTTQAQFYQQLSENRTLIRGSKVWNRREAWPLSEEATKTLIPENECNEADSKGREGVQTLVTKLLQKLASNEPTREAATSLPDPLAFQKVSFGTRKPDMVNYAKGKTGSLGITSFGDLKGRGEGDFSDEQKGHVLDMAYSYMTKVGLNRPFVIVFLSDGVRWQFFRVARDESGIKFFEGRVYADYKEGWERYLALLKANSQDLGYAMPEIPGVELTSALGRGGAASAYKGRSDENDVVVKVYAADMEGSLQAESSALELLLGIDNVPQLVRVADLTSALPGTLGRAVVATPVGIPVLPVPSGVPVNGDHLCQLVVALKNAHERGLVHRDLKPQNVYLYNDKIILNDWSSSASLHIKAATDGAANGRETWEGTLGFSVHFSEKKFAKLSLNARDLVSLVRCSYSLLFKELPPVDAKLAETFWEQRFREGTHWSVAVELAEKEDYEQLGRSLRMMK